MMTTKILLVADTVRLTQTAQRLFPKMGIDVLSARYSLEALQILQEHEVAAVFIDHGLPGLDAFALLQTIRLHYPVVEVLFLVEFEQLEVAARAMRNGASDYLAKPVSMKALLEKTEEVRQRNQIHKHRIDDALHMAPLFKKGDKGTN